MHNSKLLIGILILMAGVAFILAGCTKDEVVPAEQPPEGSITATSTAINAGESIVLTANYTDPNDDELTFSWVVEAGTLFDPDSSVTAWNAPETRGIYSFYLTVSDETYDVLDSIRIDVGQYEPPTGEDEAYFIGAEACANSGCHQELIVGGDQYPWLYEEWLETSHAQAFANLLDIGYARDDNCLPCHTTGWNADADNGGYDEYKFPYLEGVGCENCHGPGSQHQFTLQTDDTLQSCVNTGACHPGADETVWNWGNRNDIPDPENPSDTLVYPHPNPWPEGFDSSMVITMEAQPCGDCHQDQHYPYYSEWQSSAHSTSHLASGGAADCGPACHTGIGFLNIDIFDNSYPIEPEDNAIVCLACHESHFPKYDGEVRIPVGFLCQRCHNEEQLDVETSITDEPNHVHGPMFKGYGGYEYDDSEYDNSGHTTALRLDGCAACHVYMVDTDNNGFDYNTPHTFTGVTIENCQVEGCHPGATDYNINSVQDQVDSLLTVLSDLIESAPDGDAKDRATFNKLFVENDGSKGVHNSTYAIQLLTDSIEDLE
ncbi:MAG: hypothetical protein GF315_10435 [candidate division Zixibacteria bacterium]|nr:hypothetical protein [candidate division Zixibacteria bacterium]